MSQAALREELAVAFEIGPRTDEETYDMGSQGKFAAHRSEIHVRVINGTKYAFGRFTYETGLVVIQAIVVGKWRPDVHYWTNAKEPARGA